MPAVSSCRNWALELFHEMTRSQTSLDAVSYGSPSDNRNWVGSSGPFSRSLQFVELDQCWTQPGTPERHSASTTQLALHASPIFKFNRVIYNIEIYTVTGRIISWHQIYGVCWKINLFILFLFHCTTHVFVEWQWNLGSAVAACQRAAQWQSSLILLMEVRQNQLSNAVIETLGEFGRRNWDDWDVLRHRHDHLDTMATLAASNSHTMK